jgi:acyl-CoA reductase-like NAD-dependent aldehyde dehydrogenase
MTDQFVWVDPFEEIERANRAATYARQEGYSEGTQVVRDFAKGRAREALERNCEAVAHRVAEEQVKPYLAQHFGDLQDRRQRVQVATDNARALYAPMIEHFAKHVSVDAVLKPEELRTVEYRFEERRPFRYAFVADRRGW